LLKVTQSHSKSLKVAQSLSKMFKIDQSCLKNAVAQSRSKLLKKRRLPKLLKIAQSWSKMLKKHSYSRLFRGETIIRGNVPNPNKHHIWNSPYIIGSLRLLLHIEKQHNMKCRRWFILREVFVMNLGNPSARPEY
jgi:hypothetical protein